MFVKYVSAKDSQVFEPLFIAQYLLCPVNTIVIAYLLLWMAEKNNFQDIPGKKQTNQNYARKSKSDVYLRYILLVNLLNIVTKYGRNPEYNFEKDAGLEFLLQGEYGVFKQDEKVKQLLALDGFLTIWLITLPEKFKEWYENCNKTNCAATFAARDIHIMDTMEVPNFPKFEGSKETKMALTYKAVSYNFLPDSWNLEVAFEVF